MASLFARGYKFDFDKNKLTVSGLLVVKSNPDAAQIIINGKPEATTNTNISLAPETYDLEIKKEGYISWRKRITIEKEVVTEIDAHLFKSVPSLSPITLNSSVGPIASDDFTKIAYVANATQSNLNDDKEGLWVIENVNLPLGFSKDPKRITDGNLTNSNWVWSPDGRQILLTTNTGSYLLDAGTYTPQASRINIASQMEEILEEWMQEREKKFLAQIRILPEKMQDVVKNNASRVIFSPDETKILYLADSEAQIPDQLIKPVPGASTQKEERNIKKDNIYVYDIKEDRNFPISNDAEDIINCPNVNSPALLITCKKSLIWLPTSNHLIFADEGKILIVDYDGTNRQEVYAGSYITPNVFSTLSNDRLLILTNLGSDSSEANLYALTIK